MELKQKGVTVCPYCGHEDADYQDWTDLESEEAEFTLECSNEKCLKEFNVKMEYIPTFTTSKKEDES